MGCYFPQRIPAAFFAISLCFLAVLAAARLAAHAPQRHSGGVLAVLGGDVFHLTGGDLGGVAAGVGGALFAFWTSRRLCAPIS